MTDLPKPSKGGLHYRLTSSEWEKVWQELKPTEVRILYHLRLLDPFGDRSLDIGVRELARTLNIDHSTVSRALKTLDAKGYIDLELLQVKVRIHSKVEAVVSESTTSVSTHHQRSLRTTSDRYAPPQTEALEPEAFAESAAKPISTESDFVPEQTSLKNSVQQNSGATPTPALLSGKGYSEISQMVPDRASVPLNAALLAVIRKVEEGHPEEAYSRVSAAISAYLEQRETVRNPQAFISAALQRGFTSNQAKREKQRTAKTSEKTSLPPALAAPQITMPQAVDLSGLIAEIQIHCQRLGLTVKQALERFGRAGRSLADLTDIDLSTLRLEMAGW